MPAFSPCRIDHIVLRVKSLERSIAFYQSVLGCTVERERPDLGLVHLRAGESLIDLLSLDGPLGRKGGAGPGAEGRNLDHFCLRVEPFDAQDMIAHLASLGIAPIGPLAHNFGSEGVGPSLYLADPDGNVLELKGPAVAEA